MGSRKVTMENPKDKFQDKNKVKVGTLKWLLSHLQFHGANRLYSRESRWYWMPSMLFLIMFASTLLYLATTRYLSNPTYMSEIETGDVTSTFPSVIILLTVVFSDSKTEEFLSTIKYPDGLNKSYVRAALPQLAAFFSPDVKYKAKDLENLEYLLNYNKIDIEDAGRRLTESCEEAFIRCRWNNVFLNCSDIFRMELNRDGFCCVFNGRSLRREMRENLNLKRNPAPWITLRTGYSQGLMIAFNQSQKHRDINLSYKWIGLQTGQQFIDPSTNGTPLIPGNEQWFPYYVRSNRITDAAKRLGVTLRRCRMSDEELEYFPNYKKIYCALECEMSNSIKRCSCVLLTHPRPPGISYCNARHLRCATRASLNTENCRCPSTCNVESAVVRTSSFTLDPSVPTFDNFYKGLDYGKVTVVRIFIQKRKSRTKQRSSYYSYLDLFSQLGGIFNVFFGCSILTILGVMQFMFRVIISLWIKLLNKLQTKPNISMQNNTNVIRTPISDNREI